ncbi:MAG: hypothetical protein JW881_05330 [Spirochaetales bacterium]|nr:hypothetical protein [Spirochaetales bacterium]
MMRKIYIILACISGILLLIGCDLFSSSCVLTCRMEDPPRQWKDTFRSLVCEIRYFDTDGKHKSIVTDNTDWEIAIPVRKLRNSPILAFPMADGIPLPPAGALYPHDIDNPVSLSVVLTWEKGFISSLLMECMALGEDMSALNVIRLQKELEEISGGDFWNLDYSGLAQSLTAKQFSIRSIKRLPCREIALDPGEGDWFTESPFSPLYRVEQGRLLTEQFPYGYHRLFRLSSGVAYTFYVDQKETLIIPHEKKLPAMDTADR